MNKNLSTALFNFAQTFEYYPMYPDNIDFDRDKYAKELEKCIKENFDYTIEKYGTIPSKELGKPSIIYD